MTSLSYNKEDEIIQAFNSRSRYLDEISNIDNPYFESMMGRIYPSELQLNRANISADLFHPKFMISAMTFILIQ